ncbi:XRE family transcriptional regulator [Zymobacter palmae]|uniref:XRE family transcriptional regulator n=1 Tax=Zymobacter palmae TaxID=33074 RepID=UPI000482C168|nr:S24 family peptidase [Zymobacter palmae]
MKKNTLGERLKSERMRLGLSQTALGAACGVKKTTQINYEKDLTSPSAAYLTAAKGLGVDIWYVIEGEVCKKQPGSSVEKVTMVPLYDLEAAAGHGRILSQENIARMCSIDEELLGQHGLRPELCAMLTVKGDSMEPTLQDGDTILVDRTQTTPDGIFLIQMDDTLRVKRVQRAAGGAYILISDNTRYREELIPPTELNTISLLGKCVLKISSVS